MSDRASEVLIQDDGELGALRVLLDEIGVPYAEKMPDPVTSLALLFSTPRHALRLGSAGSLLPESATHIVLADGISNTTRAQLHRFDCAYVVDQGFHADAMELLILHALYRGPERRKSNRITLGEEVKIKCGWRSHGVTLIQLSEQGCGVVCNWDGQTGKQITVLLPKTLTEGSQASLKGRIVGRASKTGGEITLSIVFSSITGEMSETIRSIMKRRALGDFNMTPGPGSAQPDAEEVGDSADDGPVADIDYEDRRQSPRAQYGERVLASGGGRARALIGRDLSVGGMLVEPNEEIVPGEKVKLVLFGKRGSEPIAVRAEVLRDSGETGVALRFLNLSSETHARLEALVDSLPMLSGGDPGTSSARSGRSLVISGLLERRRS